jgi:release factor glutamine methyltransferase
VTVAAETRAAAWRRAGGRVDRTDARRLLEAVCGCSHAGLIADGERLLSADEAARFEALVERREAGEPLAYLLGSADFCGLEFAVSPAVLIPRADTEVLVEQSVARAQMLRAPRVVDLGTGSGIVAITIALRCPEARVTAVDVSPEAIAVARANATRHGARVAFAEGDWYAPLAGERFDLVVANPPYVAAGDAHLLDDGLPYEPAVALSDGVEGGDGCACIAAIIAGAPRHLARGGWLLIEHGYDQAVKVRERLAAAGFHDVASWPDAARIERVSGGRLGTET